jgi:hypothetical protein
MQSSLKQSMHIDKIYGVNDLTRCWDGCASSLMALMTYSGRNWRIIEGYQETLTNKELWELGGSSAENEDKQEKPAAWNQHKFAEVFWAAKH